MFQQKHHSHHWQASEVPTYTFIISVFPLSYSSNEMSSKVCVQTAFIHHLQPQVSYRCEFYENQHVLWESVGHVGFVVEYDSFSCEIAWNKSFISEKFMINIGPCVRVYRCTTCECVCVCVFSHMHTCPSPPTANQLWIIEQHTTGSITITLNF